MTGIRGQHGARHERRPLVGRHQQADHGRDAARELGGVGAGAARRGQASYAEGVRQRGRVEDHDHAARGRRRGARRRRAGRRAAAAGRAAARTAATPARRPEPRSKQRRVHTSASIWSSGAPTTTIRPRPRRRGPSASRAAVARTGSPATRWWRAHGPRQAAGRAGRPSRTTSSASTLVATRTSSSAGRVRGVDGPGAVGRPRDADQGQVGLAATGRGGGQDPLGEVRRDAAGEVEAAQQLELLGAGQHRAVGWPGVLGAGQLELLGAGRPPGRLAGPRRPGRRTAVAQVRDPAPRARGPGLPAAGATAAWLTARAAGGPGRAGAGPGSRRRCARRPRGSSP